MEKNPRLALLQEVGLNEAEALIYNLLLTKGTSHARDLVDESKLGRGNVYNVLNSLVIKDLVLAIEGKQTTYQALDPSKLEKLVEAKLRSAERLRAEYKEALPHLASAFNLSTGKPTIQVFEGLEGMERALEDSLQAKSDILTIINLQALTPEFAKANEKYVKRRLAKGVQKRILLKDTPQNRLAVKAMDQTHTHYRFLSQLDEQFISACEIYDNTVSFLTLAPGKHIAVTIQDKQIATLQKALFEALWIQAVPNHSAATDHS